jgi:hypothetical protein
MASRLPDASDADEDKIVVELYCTSPECDPIVELVGAIAKSVRWKDRVEVHVQQFDDGPHAETPYGSIRSDTVIVCGTHIIRDAHYTALKHALEDCEECGPS